MLCPYEEEEDFFKRNTTPNLQKRGNFMGDMMLYEDNFKDSSQSRGETMADEPSITRCSFQDPKEKAKSETRDWLNNTPWNKGFLLGEVDGIRANYSGSLVSLTDICMKPLREACATQSILQYYKMDPKNLEGFRGVDHAEYCFQHYTSDEDCLSAFKGPLELSTALGGFSGNNYS
ncbi:hypothetical protein L1987_59128 [Smallanthus sonchifolius]|uniref:Uncharacterized protein n=1 Tax=Smallanthus sonchifolius TaxID=185202 RepID=A0ACB9D4F2_9ASTR|nr:hypothetical protein L1987_59128 [Smallanthus sonchifolius]